MQQKPFIVLFTIAQLIFAANFKVAAQNNLADTSGTAVPLKGISNINHRMNFLKVNLTGLLLKNYSFQYERVLSRKFSFAIAYRAMPSTTLPFKNSILKAVGNDDLKTAKTIEDFRLSNFAITPEIRFYTGKKGYGQGFYIAAFYRYASFKSNDVNVFYTDDAGAESSIKMSGKVTGNTGGILFGVQHTYGKHVVLDLWLFGPHYGSGKGEFLGTSSAPLSAEEQKSLKDELDGIDLPLTNKTVTVTANGASLKLDGPWAGIRAGISLGFRF